MDVTPQTGDDTEMLPAMLDLAGAESLHAQMQQACLHDGPIVLNGRRVERISTACLQILAAASRSAHARGVSFALQAASPVLQSGLHELGLHAVLGEAETPVLHESRHS